MTEFALTFSQKLDLKLALLDQAAWMDIYNDASAEYNRLGDLVIGPDESLALLLARREAASVAMAYAQGKYAATQAKVRRMMVGSPEMDAYMVAAQKLACEAHASAHH